MANEYTYQTVVGGTPAFDVSVTSWLSMHRAFEGLLDFAEGLG